MVVCLFLSSKLCIGSFRWKYWRDARREEGGARLVFTTRCQSDFTFKRVEGQAVSTVFATKRLAEGPGCGTEREDSPEEEIVCCLERCGLSSSKKCCLSSLVLPRSVAEQPMANYLPFVVSWEGNLEGTGVQPWTLFGRGRLAIFWS